MKRLSKMESSETKKNESVTNQEIPFKACSVSLTTYIPEMKMQLYPVLKQNNRLR